jgi:DNA polymerase I-like protein with 3'-5' exonuclease and polymerase domains
MSRIAGLSFRGYNPLGIWRGDVMSQVYNPESDLMEQIERLELEFRNVLRRIEHARANVDKRVLNRQLQEIGDEITHLQQQLP